MNKQSNQLYSLMGKLNQQLHRLAVAQSQDDALQPGQARLLRVLSAHDGATQKELADQIVIRPASMTHLLHRLEEAGYVQRKPNPDDRRSTNVFLTELGAERATTLKSSRDDYAEELFAILTAEEQEDLFHLLSRLETEWERMAQERTDYLLLFLWFFPHCSKDTLESFCTDNEVDAKTLFSLLERYPFPSEELDSSTAHGGRHGMGQGGGRQGRRRAGSPHGNGPGAPQEGRRSRHAGNGGRGAHAHDDFFSHGGPHREHTGRMRRDLIRSGFDLEQLRTELEEIGVTQAVCKDFITTLDSGLQD